MATAYAVELPTTRQTRFFLSPTTDIHDPNYIPLLNGANFQADYNDQNLSGIPSKPQVATSLKRTKSAAAPEALFQDAPNTPTLRDRLPRSKYATAAHEIGSSQIPSVNTYNEQNSGLTEGSVASHTEGESTVTTTVDDHEHTTAASGYSASKVEDIQFPPVPASARSSISTSTKKSYVPTSRYNQKKSLPTLPVPPAMPKSRSQVSLSSSYAVDQSVQSPSPAPQQFAAQLPPASIPLPPSAVNTPVVAQMPVIPSMEVGQTPPFHASPNNASTTTRANTAKSTASERRNRALHSHPSNTTLEDVSEASVQKAKDEKSLVSSPSIGNPPESRMSVSRSRATSPPILPLPDLPAHMPKRPPTRERLPASSQPASPALSQMRSSNLVIPSPVFRPGASPQSRNDRPTSSRAVGDHTELAEFMLNKKTTVFRRFDEVHVRMLLHLQDEIAQLEKQLLALEEKDSPSNGGIARMDATNMMAKANIMRDLRKTLAEYDHLFANWSAMQANKASAETRSNLATFLQSKNAVKDMKWLEDSKDLSAVSIDPNREAAETRTATKPEAPTAALRASSSSEEKDDKRLTSKPSGGGGGSSSMLALFGCASRRK